MASKVYYSILIFLCCFVSNVSAQRPILTDEEQITEVVTKEVNEIFRSEEFLKKKNKKYAEVKGAMTIDIGVVQNGKVSSFFKVDSEIKNIDFINFIQSPSCKLSLGA